MGRKENVKKCKSPKGKGATGVELTKAALLTAVFCMLAPHTVFLPVSPVGVTLGSFLLYLTGVLLGPRLGCISVFLYLLLGFLGLPIFSGYTAGAGVLLGPTGGYLLGYLPCVALVGWFVGKKGKGKGGIFFFLLGAVLGTLALYMVGTAWFLFVYTKGGSVTEAVVSCVLLFLPADAVKILMATVLYKPLRRLLAQHGSVWYDY